MAEYKAIRGHTIRTIAGDASPLVVGDIWYSSTTRKIRGAKLGAGAWATGGNLNTAIQYHGGFGIQTAAVSVSGNFTPGSPPLESVETEEYNGTAWTEVNDNNTAGDGFSGCGILTAGIINGRSPGSQLTESYDGTTWTEVNDMQTSSRGKRADAGTQAAAVCAGGENHPNVMVDSEEWDGTNLAEGNNLNNGRSTNYGGMGTQTAAIIAGGAPPTNTPLRAYAETYDGTSWTEVADLNTARVYGAGAGDQTDCIYWGGITAPVTDITEAYDGTSWTEVADLGTGVAGTAGGGTQSSALTFGGAGPDGATAQVVTEEWDKSVAAVTFTSS